MRRRSFSRSRRRGTSRRTFSRRRRGSAGRLRSGRIGFRL